uniref:Uncharacterized protein n=1 Tax=Oryza brachyantha TaxID=4533 RepID=J3KUW4_ORYBR
ACIVQLQRITSRSQKKMFCFYLHTLVNYAEILLHKYATGIVVLTINPLLSGV